MGAGLNDQAARAASVAPLAKFGRDPKKLRAVICVERPRKIILLFEGGDALPAGPQTKMGFGYSGEGPRNLSSFLKAAGFAFTEAEQFCAIRAYRNDGTIVEGSLVGDEIRWQDGTVTLVPEFPNLS